MERQTACKDFEQGLALYYYGECAVEERSRIEEHLKGCAACSSFLADLGKLLPLTVKADEPPEPFWDDYSRELRRKIAAAEEKSPWWRSVLPTLRPWPVPALAAALILVLAITLTFTVVKRRPEQLPSDETELLEIVVMGQSLEFFNTMDLLDAMDLIEAMGGPGGSA